MGDTIIRRQRTTFTVVPNEIVNDRRIGLKAFGLLIHMLSRPNDWVFSQEQMGAELGEGREAMRNAMRQLIDAGYVQREVTRDAATGRLVTVTVVTESPDTGLPAPAQPAPADPAVGKPVSLLNTQEPKTEEPRGAEAPARRGVELETYLKTLEEKGEKFISDSPALMAYARQCAIPDDLMILAWKVYREYHRTSRKRYTDWRRAFLDAIRSGYSYCRVWYFDGLTGKIVISPRGREHAARIAAIEAEAVA